MATMILMQLLGIGILGGVVYGASYTAGRNPKLKRTWLFVGFLMFVVGVLNIVVNMVGIYYSFFGWIEMMGKLGAVLFKLGLIFGGIAIVVLVTHDEEAYDEYFDGSKYKE